MYENAFNKIERDLRAEEGIANELDYVEQTSWVLFLKYLHDLETERSDRAELNGEDYTPIIDGEFRWDKWAAPKKNGEFDHNAARIGDDLIKFVDQELFPYLASFRQSATGPQTIQYKIGEVFTELRNKFRSGYILRDVLEAVDGLSFNTQAERHELSQLYETRIRRMGNAGRNGGEYYTPRPLIRAMIKVVDPKIGETIYDGAVGSAGFLCEAFDYLRTDKLSASEYETLQTKTFYGQEKKGLAYIIGIMNMVLHGIEAPNLIHSNTLNENVMDIQEKDRHDIILANPPFGGGERREVQQNFPIRTGETAYLFLQHFIRKLKAGGRAAVVIKNTFLSNTDNASVALRKELLEAAELHTILDCPQGTFQGAGVKTVVLFFEKGAPTRDIWYYQLDPGRSLGKTNPLNDDDLKEFVELQRTRANGRKSWIINRADLDEDTYDLSVKNPNIPEAEPIHSPQRISADMQVRNERVGHLIKGFDKLFENKGWALRSISSFAKTGAGGTPRKNNKEFYEGGDIPWLLSGEVANPNISTAKNYITRAGLENSSAKVFPSGSVLVAMYGATAGEVGILRFEAATNQAVCAILPGEEHISEYLYYALLHAKAELVSQAVGNAQPNISQAKIKALKVPLPPIEVQNEIVDSLSDAFKRIDSVRENLLANLQGADDLRNALLINAFKPHLDKSVEQGI